MDIWIISSLGFLHISGVPDVCDPSAGQFHTTLLDNQIILINIYDMEHIIITARREMRWKCSVSEFPVLNMAVKKRLQYQKEKKEKKKEKKKEIDE